MKGIYCYIDTQKNDEIVYIGKDSNIDKNKRHTDHKKPSFYNVQQINRVLQNNPWRYEYKVLKQGIFNEPLLNSLEIIYIKRYDPKFNFTKGGEGALGFKHTKESRKKMSEAHKGHSVSDETRKRMSEAHKGENNSMYGKKQSIESNIKNSISRGNSSGYFRVCKSKQPACNQGFIWMYRWTNENGKRKTLTSVDIKKLEQKVKDKGLEWRKL